MSWLTPLGFLGLIGLIILIIIYIIKPNFQQKIISSSYIWKLSLKYKRKRIPINKFRNILTFIAQVLTITLCAGILAGPIIQADEESKAQERIVIIDASASMRAHINDETRFHRAVDMAKDLAREVAANENYISIILAGQKASFVVQRAGADTLQETYEALDALVDVKNFQCGYGTADVDGAMKLAETVLEVNPKAAVSFLTGKEYYDAGKVNVVNEGISDSSEWNAGILDVRATMEENYYKIEIDVACYGMDAAVPLTMTIKGANEDKQTIEREAYVPCTSDEVQTVTYWADFDNTDDPNSVFVFMYEEIHVTLGVDDNYDLDNDFYVYGGVKPVIRVQFYSTTNGNFFPGILMAWRNTHRDTWDIDIKEVKDVDENNPVAPELEGYDVYIFENKMPDTMPTDGIVILLNPDKAPLGSGLSITSTWPVTYPEATPLEGDTTHDVMKYVNPSNIELMKHASIDGGASYGYDTLMSCGGWSTVLVKNTAAEKVAVVGFSTQWSNISITSDLPILYLNLLNYFMPATVEKNAYDVNETISVNARSLELVVNDPNGVEMRVEAFPSEITLSLPGTYSMTQTPMSGLETTENIYVKSPASESNITCKLDSLVNPYIELDQEEDDFDPIFYFALAIVALLFAEWWLQSREHF